ncbi:hypothetical protein, partial [Gaetbulibacter saemankumensis]|uniref:hypothetical protein n=1 Tax=Gaetbulibacter saemankumensis TaxID=311208 RepID=UPI0012FAD1AB
MYKITNNDFIGKFSKSYKTFLLCCLSIITFGLSTQFFYAQDVGSTVIKANFGIDGDAYANESEFLNLDDPNNPVLVNGANTDDWFLNLASYPGTGLGVIDQTQPAPAGNTPFERRQSITADDVGNARVPFAIANFPVVIDLSGGPTAYLWLDAVYGRDTYVSGGGTETSYFAGGSDKNSDNPINWTLGTSGSVPQKTDIIDVFAHLRGEGPRVPPNMLDPSDPLYDANDDRPFTKLWAYAGASLVVTNGNKHLDFEFFRKGLQDPADLADPTKLGPDGGRTAWQFDTDWSILIPGTIIVSVDYINGGTVPSVRIRCWMSEDDYNNFDNGNAARPFNVDKSVSFISGVGTTVDGVVYGYAAINPKGNDIAAWGRVNDNMSDDAGSLTLGPPWGTWHGSSPDAVTDYQRYQFVEIGIDLSAFGLDRRGSQDPCSNILGSLLVKTRSSGGGPNEGAFDSELKDFAGPYLFGFLGGPPEIAADPLTACEQGDTGQATFDLETAIDEANSTPGTTITFHDTSLADAEVGANPIGSPESYSVTVGESPKTIWVRSLRPDSQCDAVTSFTVDVYDNPDFDVTDLESCEEGTTEAATFNLTLAISNADSGTWSYSDSEGSIGDPTNYSAPLGKTTITVRLDNDNDSDEGCYTQKTFDVDVYDNPDFDVADLESCEEGTSEAATFNLTLAISNADSGTWSYSDSEGSIGD